MKGGGQTRFLHATVKMQQHNVLFAIYVKILGSNDLIREHLKDEDLKHAGVPDRFIYPTL